MSPSKPSWSETERLENLWSGEFGREYITRNDTDFAYREPFWREMTALMRPGRVLEVGCSIGGNLKWLVSPGREVWGVDISREAVETVRRRLIDVCVAVSPARELPFRDDYFDLVFTAGVLIHQPDDSLHQVMSEMVRCSRSYVMSAEYFSPEDTEVPYRGIDGALFKRDYGSRFLESFPLALVDSGHLAQESTGWDEVTWWLFKKKDPA